MIKALLMVLLLLGITGSALAVIYSKYQSRLLFMSIQEMEEELDRYEVEWGQLQLEMSTLIDHGRIEDVARQKLGMVEPDREQIVHVID